MVTGGLEQAQFQIVELRNDTLNITFVIKNGNDETSQDLYFRKSTDLRGRL
ncbi:hypothetical protein DI53_0728 [Sphingobacterium deserti]|uniref:Uncharacterized protein n=1 Tax=Sphingobacterium deserti TaxID=1229276 RepID=A0A0B8TA19_9SPHI|nr:hypothetical protein DI53_0728 [Sphingobacterium deserti]